MSRQTHTLDVATVELAGGRELRVALFRTQEGEASELVLAVGYSDGARWTELLGEGLSLPPAALPGLREALDSLQPESTDGGPEA